MRVPRGPSNAPQSLNHSVTMLSAAVNHGMAQVIVMGIPTVERAVIQKEDKTGNYTLLVEGTGLQVCATMTGSRGLCA